MATITKLKAAVNNKNLPILGEDGNLYNYYYGKFVNKLSEYSVTPTMTEKNALNAFIQDGIDNGWIEKVKYLMPFIGNSTNPISGLVPLIDNVANYELSAESVNADAFTYNQDGTIKTLGNPNYSMPDIPLPISNDDMGGGMSLFVNKTYYDDEPKTTATKIIVNIFKDDNNYFRFTVGYQSSGENYFIGRSYRKDGTLANPTKIIGSEIVSGNNVGAFVAYYKESISFKTKRYAIVKGSSSPTESMSGAAMDAGYFDYVGGCGAALSNSNLPLLCRVNMLAAFDPLTVNKADMDNFNTAVFTLMTALGR